MAGRRDLVCARTLLEASAQFATLRDAILPMGRAFSGLVWAADADSRAAYLTEVRVLHELAASALANTLALAEACAAGAAEVPSAAQAVAPKADELRGLAAQLMTAANRMEGYAPTPEHELRKPPRHLFEGLHPFS